MFKKTISYLVLTSLIFSFLPLMARAESGNFNQTNFDLETNQAFSVIINIQDLNEVNSVELVLEYDPTIISYLDFMPGTLMNPIDLFFTKATKLPVDVNTERLSVAVATEGMNGSISGSGELVTINFRANANGNSNIKMNSLLIYPTDFMIPPINADVASPVTVTVTTPDTIAPVRSNSNPSGVLSHDITETMISIDTDEDAVCHYSDTADTLFADSLEMTTTGATNHSVLVNGLSAGNAYNYYVRCSDALGNINEDDYLVSFSTDDEPVVVPIPELSFNQTDYVNINNNTIINLTLNAKDLLEVSSVEVVLEYNPNIITYLNSVSGPLMDPIDPLFSVSATSSIDVDTEQLTLSVATDMFGSVSGDGELTTISFITNMEGGSTKVFMKFFSVYTISSFAPLDGVTTTPVTVTVTTPDIIAPVRSNSNPSGVLSHDITETMISIDTDEDAVCHYSDTADTLFADSLEMTTTGATNHSVLVNGLSAGNAYNYYVRCSDALGNINEDDYLVSFSTDDEPVVVVAEPEPQAVSSGGLSIYMLKAQAEKRKEEQKKSDEKNKNKNIGNSQDKEVVGDVKVLGFSKYPDGSLIRTSDFKVYVIDGDNIRYISKKEDLFKYSGEIIYNVDDEYINQYKVLRYSNGDLIREKGDDKIFNIVDNKLKQVLNLSELRKNFVEQEIFNITKEEMFLYKK